LPPFHGRRLSTISSTISFVARPPGAGSFSLDIAHRPTALMGSRRGTSRTAVVKCPATVGRPAPRLTDSLLRYELAFERRGLADRAAGPRQQVPDRAVVPSPAPRRPHAAVIQRGGDGANVVTPDACIWRTMGSTLAAKASAASRFAAMPLACASWAWIDLAPFFVVRHCRRRRSQIDCRRPTNGATVPAMSSVRMECKAQD